MKHSIVSADLKIRDLASMLEQHVILFVQRGGVLVGSVTNGDFRRGISLGLSLDDGLDRLMNRSPLFVLERDDYKTRLERVRRLPPGLRYLPELNERGEIIRVVSDRGLVSIPNIAVIMAGGLGSRLRSLTKSIPKPMLRIGEKPILQLIIEQSRRAGISRFVLSVNYKAEVIKDYFKDGADFDVKIEYIEETVRRGTAGCLSLLSVLPNDPFLIMNGDVLTDLDLNALLVFHGEQAAAASVCTHDYQLTVPYGVIETNHGRIVSINEKPTFGYSISAGIYVLNPECLALVPPTDLFDMPSLLSKILAQGSMVAAYPLPGYWMDIGSLEDFHRASHEYRDALDRGNSLENKAYSNIRCDQSPAGNCWNSIN